MITLLTLVQIACYQSAALPGIYRMWKRGSSEDLSCYREVLILVGATFQIIAMHLAATKWQIFMSPITSIISVSCVLATIIYFRRPIGQTDN